MKILSVVLGIFAASLLLAYPTVEDAKEFKNIAETNRFAAYEYAIDLIAQCGWRGLQQDAEISMVMECVITNAFIELHTLTNNVNNLRRELSMRKALLSTPKEFDPNCTLLLSRVVMDCFANDLNNLRPIDLKYEFDVQRAAYELNFPSNDPCCVSINWLPYRNQYYNMVMLAGVRDEYRSTILGREIPYLRAYRDSLSPSDAIAFTNRFITVAGLSTNEVRQVFGE